MFVSTGFTKEKEKKRGFRALHGFDAEQFEIPKDVVKVYNYNKDGINE
jgi:hypothetical protein